MFYFLCSNRTATKIKYKFNILTRMTAVLVTQRTSLYENHMIINLKCDIFSSIKIYLSLCLKLLRHILRIDFYRRDGLGKNIMSCLSKIRVF